MNIIDLRSAEKAHLTQAAHILVRGFQATAPEAWPDFNAAMEQVEQTMEPHKIGRIAIDQKGRALGWIGGIPEYDGNVWTINPLVVDPSHQRQGTGRALINDLEQIAGRRGGLTLYLGTDDITGMTTLSGVDLYDGLTGHIDNIKNLHGHPYEFYQKLGFVIAGLVPDANGLGKPDILMAKRISPANQVPD